MKRAAEYLGEAFLYTVAGVATVVEVSRSNYEKAEKDRAASARRAEQEESVRRLAERVEELHLRLEEMTGRASGPGRGRRLLSSLFSNPDGAARM